MRHNGNQFNDLEKVDNNGNLGISSFDLTNAFTAWGQFIIHDILKTPDEVSQSSEKQFLLHSSSYLD